MQKQKAEKYYQKALKQMEKLVGNKTTYGKQLKYWANQLFDDRFIGVFASNTLPKRLKANQMLIVNLDEIDEPGSHWICVVKSKNNTILAYDSFGRSIEQIIPSLKQKYKKSKVKSTERDSEQTIRESNCGARCLAFLKVYNDLGFEYAKYI